MRVCAISWCIDIPGLQVYIFRRTFGALQQNHMDGPTGFPELLQPYIKAKQCRIVGMDIIWANGSKIHLRHCQYAKDVYTYQGAEIHVLMIDELTQWEKRMYLYLRGRVRMVGLEVPDKHKGLFPRVLVGANPGGVGHNWVKQCWVDQPPGAHRMPKTDGGMIREYIPARLEDNRILMEQDPDYEDKLNGLGDPALVKAMRNGDWNIVAGAALDDVWNEAVHVLPPFRIPESWYVDRTHDWGSAKPFSVGWWAESDGSPVRMADGTIKHFPRGTLFRIWDWYGWNGNANEGARLDNVEIAIGVKEGDRYVEQELMMGGRVHPGPADGMIFDVTNGRSIAGDYLAKGVKFLDTADKSPGSRVNGLSRIRTLLRNGLKNDREEPALYIFSHCVHWIRTVPAIPRSERHPEDVDSAAEDHAYDETRYRVLQKKRPPGVVEVGF
jgi:hypothetical protein